MDETLKKLQETEAKSSTPVAQRKSFKDILRGQELARLGIESKGTNTLIEETTTLGGFMVPDEFSNELIEVVRSKSVVMDLASKYPMTRDHLLIPRISVGGSIYWEQTGGFTTKTNTDVTFAQLDLAAKTVYGLAYVSTQLAEDSSPDAVSAVQRDLAGALVAGMELAFLEGAGSGADPITGVSATGSIGTGAAGAALTADDIADAIATVETSNFAPNGIVAHPTVKNILRKLKDSSGQYLWADPRAEELPTIFGVPFYATSNTTATAGSRIVFVGDWSQAAVGMRKEITMALSEHVAFDKNQIAVRLEARVGFGLKQPAAFYTITSV